LDIDEQLYIYNLGKIEGASSKITNSTPLGLPKHRPFALMNVKHQMTTIEKLFWTSIKILFTSMKITMSKMP
jgi:hypothetical protein